MRLLFVTLSLLVLHSVSAQDTISQVENIIKVIPNKQMESEKAEETASTEDVFSVNVDGKVYEALITDEGDTLILANIDEISITSLRTFANAAEEAKYNKFRRYALKVFPYAKEAIQIYREVEWADKNLKRRERKRKMKDLEKQLTEEFEEPLRKLTKLQGKILLKMIEKETGVTTYEIVRKIKGRWRAFYWHQFSKLYSYDLKEGYQEGKYRILDAVLQDFDISHRIEKGNNLKYIQIDDVRK